APEWELFSPCSPEDLVDISCSLLCVFVLICKCRDRAGSGTRARENIVTRFDVELTDRVTESVRAGQFHRELGLFDASAIVAGSMIGSGIFIVSADVARTVGSPGWLLLVWGLTAIVTILGALSYGELAAMMPRAGGQYVYLREAYSPLLGFLYGWTLFLVIQTGTIAAVAVAFAKFLRVVVSWVSAEYTLAPVGPGSLSQPRPVAIGRLGLL